MKDLGGLYRAKPWLAILFLIPALSLAGLPPLSGFWAKLVIIRAGLEAEAYVAVGVALVVGLLTLYSMTKIWNEAFWKPLPVASPSGGTLQTPSRATLAWMVAPVVVLAAITVCIGLYAEPFVALAERSATELLTPALYVDAVLGPVDAAPLATETP